MANDDDPTPAQRLAELTKGEEIALHIDTCKGLEGRPMAIAERTDDGTFRFLAHRGSDWAAKGKILLAFADDQNGSWVTAKGKQKVRGDRATIERLWSPIAKAWFEGPEDPELVVLEVRVKEFAWWDTSAN